MTAIVRSFSPLANSVVTASASLSSIVPADQYGRLGSQSVLRDVVFPSERGRTDRTSQPRAACRRSLDNARHRAPSSPASLVLPPTNDALLRIVGERCDGSLPVDFPIPW